MRTGTGPKAGASRADLASRRQWSRPDVQPGDGEKREFEGKTAGISDEACVGVKDTAKSKMVSGLSGWTMGHLKDFLLGWGRKSGWGLLGREWHSLGHGSLRCLTGILAETR